MELILAVVVLVAVTLGYTFFVRPKDIPPPDPVSPTQALDERRAAIYENLRDLQFEYRVGKLSDSDYQATKLSLQKELAGVMAQIEEIRGTAKPAATVKPAASITTDPKPEPQPSETISCPHCGANFTTPMKFCGECGKEMAVKTS